MYFNSKPAKGLTTDWSIDKYYLIILYIHVFISVIYLQRILKYSSAPRDSKRFSKRVIMIGSNWSLLTRCWKRGLLFLSLYIVIFTEMNSSYIHMYICMNLLEIGELNHCYYLCLLYIAHKIVWLLVVIYPWEMVCCTSDIYNLQN